MRPGGRAGRADLPNIVLVALDGARWDRVGCYGHDRSTTPTVDSLARDGLRVATMLAESPGSLPSMASLLTGLYPAEHGAVRAGSRLRQRAAPTMAEWLKQLGYTTLCADGEGSVSTGLARGFDRRVRPEEAEAPWWRRVRALSRAVGGREAGGWALNRWLRRELREADPPLFLVVTYAECRWPFRPRWRYRRQVGAPGPGPRGWVRLRLGARRRGPWEAVARAGTDARALAAHAGRYDRALAEADDLLRDLIEALTETRHVGEERTLLLVTSTHGRHLGEHGMAGHDARLDDHLLRVPFVAWGPGWVPSGERGRLYELVDVLPSLAALLGRDLPAGHLEGRRTDLFAPETRSFGEEYAFAEWRSWTEEELAALRARNPSVDLAALAGDLVAVRDRRFRLVRAADGSEVLHDVSHDPAEEADASSTRRETVRRLREHLDRALEAWAAWEDGEEEPSPEPGPSGEHLTELGYIESP